MLNINNKVNYEINIKRKEKKYSWSTVFAWLYLKTIGRILPKRWNRWAENILYYDKTTANNEVQTDAFKTIDGSVQVDLKPEVVEKESQSVVINKDGGVQTDGVALITEEDDEALEEQLEGINQELELERLQNASLKEENRELRSAIEGLEKSYKGLTGDAGEREEELTKYKQDKKAMQDKVDEQQKTIFDQYMIIREQGEEIEATRKDNESLQAQIIELKSRLKDKEDKLIELNQQWQASKLVALLKSQTDKLCQAKDKNTELENKVSDLGHENKALRLSVNTLTAQLGEMENLGKQLQSVQESKQQLEIDLEGQLKADTKKLQEAKEGQLAKKAGAVSTVSTAKSTLSKLRNLPNKLARDKGLNNFLSGKNEELKKGFPEFKEKHFCHNVLNETIKSLSNQDDGKFESSKLLELLESNLKQSAREIIEAKVKEVVNEHCNIGKNMGKELRDDTLKAKLSPSVRKCVKKLEFNKQEGVKGQLKADTKKLQEAKEGQLAKKAGAVSTVSTAKSTLSKLRNLPNKFARDKGLNNFLSGKNEELKKGFPEFKEKHFCHNVLNETIKSLSNQDDGKFESSKLLELLESNLKQSAREIIEAKVKEVVNEHCNIGKNMGKELRDDTLKAKLSPSVRKCVKKLEFNKQEGVKGQLKADTKKLQEAKEGQLAKKAGAVSTVSTAKSTLSKLRNLPNKFARDKGLNNFLSGKNEELKKGFPEFKEKHFCHNVLNETIKSLSNQDDGKFESSKLLELLESNLKQSAREIIEAKVKEVVNEHCNIGKNMGKELRDDTLKAKLSPSVRKCVKKLEFNKQEGVNKIVDSILHSFNSKNNNNNDSVELLK